MPNKEQSALLVHRENYEVPKGQEQSVHVKIAKMDSKGNFLEKPRIIHEEVKFFEAVSKRNLEIQGYTVEILYHPLGKYSDVQIVDKDAQLQAKDAEIAALKAKLGGAPAQSDELAKMQEELAKAKAEAEKAKQEAEEAKAEAEKAKAEAGKPAEAEGSDKQPKEPKGKGGNKGGNKK